MRNYEKLSRDDKVAIVDIIEALYLNQVSFQNSIGSVNSKTIQVLEETLGVLEKCDKDIHSALTEVLGGVARVQEGWLKKSAKALAFILKRKQLKLGLGCRNVVGRGFRTQIETSFFQSW
jgi:hypothetical protein